MSTKIAIVFTIFLISSGLASLDFCDDSLEGVCQKCISGYALNQDHNCFVPVTPVNKCNQYDETTDTCISCSDSSVVYEGECLSIDECLVHDTTGASLMCTECNEGFVAVNNNSMCLPAIPNCDVHAVYIPMEGYLKCETCISGYAVMGPVDSCHPLIDNCDVLGSDLLDGMYGTCETCLSNFTLTSDNGACLPNIDNCLDYTLQSSRTSAALVCSTCDSGFELNFSGSACLPAISMCLTHTFNSDNMLICQSCETGYIVSLDGSFCYQQISECEAYTDNNSPMGEGLCSTCAAEFVLTSDCKACLSKISECSVYLSSSVNSSSHVCGECEADFVLSQNGAQCLATVANCASTELLGDSDLSVLCRVCSTGYLLSADQTTCLASIANCLDHTIVDDVIECSTCDAGYVKSNDNLACMAEVAYCVTQIEPVTFNDAVTCGECMEDFALNADATMCVVSMDNCDSATYDEALMDAVCSSCSTGYTASEDMRVCLANISECMTNVAPATFTEPLTCGECNTGFIVNHDASRCDPEIANCDSYDLTTNPVHCTGCSTGFDLSSNVCVPKIEFCEEFDYNIYGILICTSCNSERKATYDNRACHQIVDNCDTYYNISYRKPHNRCNLSGCASGFSATNGYYCQPEEKTCDARPEVSSDASTIDLSTMIGQDIIFYRADRGNYLSIFDGSSDGNNAQVTLQMYEYPEFHHFTLGVANNTDAGVYRIESTSTIYTNALLSTSINVLSADIPPYPLNLSESWQFIEVGLNTFLIQNLETGLYLDDHHATINCPVQWEIRVAA